MKGVGYTINQWATLAIRRDMKRGDDFMAHQRLVALTRSLGEIPRGLRSSAKKLASSETSIKAGEDYYLRTFGGPRNRWGDYSGISVDPSNESKFWIFNMYAAPQGTDIGGEFGRWGTAWGRTN